MFQEINRRLRGHRFYPTAAELKNYPTIYQQDSLGKNAVVHVHYFGAMGDWWITEFSKDFGKAPEGNGLDSNEEEMDAEVFGYVRLAGHGDGEFGYIDLRELEHLNVRARRGLPVPLIVERDLYWTPTTLKEVLARS